MHLPLESSLIRVFAPSGSVIGAGFLVVDAYALTCAHVVSLALGLAADTFHPPDQDLMIDFPFLDPDHRLRARVVHWVPYNPNRLVEDVAVLALQDALPARAHGVHLLAADDLWEHPFRVFGFPSGQPNGVWATGQLRGKTAKGWIHMEDVKIPGFRLEEGFSGSPVWDETLQGVVGMAVSAEKQRTTAKAAFIMPKPLLTQAWPELQKVVRSLCPYQGLFAFKEEQAQFFFGRDDCVDQLNMALNRQPFVAVIGPSGSGKSSVVMAGLIPRLRSQGNWNITYFHPGDRPFNALATALISWLNPAMTTSDWLVAKRRITKDLRTTPYGLRDQVEALLLQQPPGTHCLMVIDQFEELYTHGLDAETQRSFLDRLVEVVQAPLDFKVVITLRADFLGHALSYRPFADILQHRDLKLGPMTRKEVEKAIEKPAHLCGAAFEPGLRERILHDLKQEPGHLPLLEFALTLLWEKQVDCQLTHQAYEAIGGVDAALADYATQTYEQLNPQEKTAARQIFLELTQLGEGTGGTRRQVHRRDLVTLQSNHGLMESVLQTLTDRKLLVTSLVEQEDEPIPVVDLVHETLIHHWPLLVQWLNENRNLLATAHSIELVAHDWEARGKPANPAFLLQGPKLIEAQHLLQQSMLVALPALAQDFIHASQRAHRWSQLRSGLAMGIPLVLIVSIGALIWQQSIHRQIQQLMEAAILGVDSPELVKVLPRAMAKAEQLQTSGDTPQALNYYRSIFKVIQKLEAKQNSQASPLSDADFQTLAESKFTVQNSIRDILQETYFPVLEQQLQQGHMGSFNGLLGATQFEDQYTEGALKTTYQIVMGDLADFNSNGSIEVDEVDLIPCELLQDIEALWRQYTAGRCGWYGTEDPYLEPACEELAGESLLPLIFNPPYVAQDKFETCPMPE